LMPALLPSCIDIIATPTRFVTYDQRSMTGRDRAA
jgi:hypothetical protein